MRSILAHRSDSEPVLLYGSLRLGTGQRLPVTITELLSDGCRVDVPELLPVGAIVRLDIPGRIPAQASVQWSTHDRAGLHFV